MVFFDKNTHCPDQKDEARKEAHRLIHKRNDTPPQRRINTVQIEKTIKHRPDLKDDEIQKALIRKKEQEKYVTQIKLRGKDERNFPSKII